MIKKLIFLSCIIITQILHSQNRYGLVEYGHIQSFGMGAPVGIDYNAYLTFNQNQSSYVFRKDSLEGGPINKMTHIENKNQHYFINKATFPNGLICHFNRIDNSLNSSNVGSNYVKEEIPVIDWKISQETKKIGALDCIKATGSFRGREYTAWFSPEIPVPFGPWKLYGLPGLILEAYDKNKEIYFYFKSLEYPTKRFSQIELPRPDTENAQWIDLNTYKKNLMQRHKKGVKRGRVLSEAGNSRLSNQVKLPMSNVYIEAFDE
ncbi:GLPGLI family protein [Robertkochia sediminum]|uniref:GLPGLI family protein n=1 Tax=Robertkochia sediminum TaxID=2785326 RepID=UPI001931EA5F|nr:GLPGLI family protein [Robertkochia sediminum]MBL7472907.1 GLPGLI family protein [Robertkochia sediminum]